MSKLPTLKELADHTGAFGVDGLSVVAASLGSPDKVDAMKKHCEDLTVALPRDLFTKFVKLGYAQADAQCLALGCIALAASAAIELVSEGPAMLAKQKAKDHKEEVDVLKELRDLVDDVENDKRDAN